MADRIAQDGYLAAGYNQVSVDDCWANKTGRDSQDRLFPDASRFPSGMKALGWAPEFAGRNGFPPPEKARARTFY